MTDRDTRLSAGSEQPRGMEPILNSLMQATLDVTTTSRPALRKRFEEILRGQVRDPAQAPLSRQSLIDIIMRETTDKIVADGWDVLGTPNVLVQGCKFVRRHARNDPTEGYADPADAAKRFAGLIADAILAAQPPAAPVEKSGIMQAAAKAAEKVASWSPSKRDYANRVVGGECSSAGNDVAAWMSFAWNGNIRFWTADPERAAAEKRQGMDLRAFTLPELIALISRMPVLPQEAGDPTNAPYYHAWLEMIDHCNKLKEENYQLRNAPQTAVEHLQFRGRHYDIIQEAIAAYDEYMLDDDYDAQGALDKIIKKMRERVSMSDAPGSEVSRPHHQEGGK
jgi:hypothetical protein